MFTVTEITAHKKVICANLTNMELSLGDQSFRTLLPNSAQKTALSQLANPFPEQLPVKCSTFDDLPYRYVPVTQLFQMQHTYATTPVAGLSFSHRFVINCMSSVFLFNMQSSSAMLTLFPSITRQAVLNE